MSGADKWPGNWGHWAPFVISRQKLCVKYSSSGAGRHVAGDMMRNDVRRCDGSTGATYQMPAPPLLGRFLCVLCSPSSSGRCMCRCRCWLAVVTRRDSVNSQLLVPGNCAAPWSRTSSPPLGPRPSNSEDQDVACVPLYPSLQPPAPPPQ